MKAGVRGVALLVAASLLATLPAAASGSRELVLVRRECGTEIGREELTVFANGTVRLRRSALPAAPDGEVVHGAGDLGEAGRPGAERWMGLGELAPDELDVFLRRLLAEDLGEAAVEASGPEGEWVESCVLELPVLEPGSAAVLPADLPAARRGVPRPTVLRYRRFDSLSLPLARVGALLDGLAERALPLRRLGAEGDPGGGALPPGYRPRVGDVLRRLDGVLFRVVRPTVDLEEDGPAGADGAGSRGTGGGWELQGVQQPLAVYVTEADLPREFVELVSREP